MSLKRKNLLWFCVAVLSLLPLVVVAEPAEVAVAEPAEVAVVGSDDPEDPAEIFELAEKAMAKQDLKEALRLFFKSANENHTPAQVRLGEYLDYSEYDEDAVGWFMTAAFQGNTKGAFGLAKMYAEGEGIEKSEGKAFFWFKFAAEKDHIGAIRVIANAYKNGRLGKEIDLKQAKFWEDKLPALEAAYQRDIEKRKEELTKAAIEKRNKRIKELKVKQEEKKEFLEEKALERAAARKAAEENALQGEVSGEAGQRLEK